MDKTQNYHQHIFNKIVDYAEHDDRIGAMILFGSRTRKNHPSDCYSDYDIIFFVNDIPSFTDNDEWLNHIADVNISFIEPTAVNGIERRVFFDNALDMDFLFYDIEDAEEVTSSPIIQSWYTKGYNILVDKINYSKLFGNSKTLVHQVPEHLDQETEGIEQEFLNIVQTFWFHTIWSTKKILRGEIWSAKQCIDSYLKTLLREVLEVQLKTKNGNSFEAWHDGRFFDEWVPKEILDKLNHSYGTYNADSLITALNNTMHLFSTEAKKTAEMLKCEYPEKAEKYAKEQIDILIH